MFRTYIDQAKEHMRKENWKGAMFCLGKAELFIGSRTLDDEGIMNHLEELDDLVQRCYAEMKPA